MIQYLLVLAENGAVPFCHYSNPEYYSQAEPVFMPLSLMQSIVEFSRTKALPINLICGRYRLPPAYENLLQTVNHVKMIPPSLSNVYPEGVVVLEADEIADFAQLPDSDQRNLILRLQRRQIRSLKTIVRSLFGKFGRLNIHLNPWKMTPNDLEDYEIQLEAISRDLQAKFAQRENFEINVLTDRMVLSQMNNCDAGVRHLTVAPNGNCYLCPAFYHAAKDSAIESFSDSMGQRTIDLIGLHDSPLCSHCDAFHCKRCIYLNKKLTLELNVPSRVQCVLSHIERDISRRMLSALHGQKAFFGLKPIADLDYRDPFIPITQPERMEPIADAGLGLLEEIYAMQKRLCRILENK